MDWYNFNIGKQEDVVSFPITPHEWEPYIPKPRRTEFWIRTDNKHTEAIKMIALDILTTNVNQHIQSPWKKLYEEMTEPEDSEGAYRSSR